MCVVCGVEWVCVCMCKSECTVFARERVGKCLKVPTTVNTSYGYL